MKYNNVIFTRILNRDEVRTEFNNILEILQRNEIHTVHILFGFNWSEEYKNRLMEIEVKSIAAEIEKAESGKFGLLGEDNFSIILKDLDTEILICHDMDLHLLFNQENEPVMDILKNWDIKQLVKHSVKKK